MSETTPARRSVRVSTPDDLVAVIPMLLGYQPKDPSVVVMCFSGNHPGLTLAYPLWPEPGKTIPSPADLATSARLHAMRAEHNTTEVFFVGYGPGQEITPHIDALRAEFTAVRVREALRVQDGRRFGYLCRDLACCPPEGAVIRTDTEAAAVVASSSHTIVADRAQLGLEVAAAAQPWRDDVDEAFHTVIAENAGRTDAAMAHEGDAAVQRLIDRYEAGDTTSDLSPVFVAEICYWLAHIPVRDRALSRVRIAVSEAHVALWGQLTRLSPEQLVLAPACLLAVTHLVRGDGAKASFAIDRARAADPARTYILTGLVAALRDHAVPPKVVEAMIKEAGQEVPQP
jgi:hypothetical protein